jgi:hypothetical protein
VQVGDDLAHLANDRFDDLVTLLQAFTSGARHATG